MFILSSSPDLILRAQSVEFSYRPLPSMQKPLSMPWRPPARRKIFRYGLNNAPYFRLVTAILKRSDEVGRSEIAVNIPGAFVERRVAWDPIFVLDAWKTFAPVTRIRSAVVVAIPNTSVFEPCDFAIRSRPVNYLLITVTVQFCCVAVSPKRQLGRRPNLRADERDRRQTTSIFQQIAGRHASGGCSALHGMFLMRGGELSRQVANPALREASFVERAHPLTTVLPGTVRVTWMRQTPD